MARLRKKRNLVVPGAVLAVLVAGIVACSGNKAFVPASIGNSAPSYDLRGDARANGNSSGTAVLNIAVPAQPKTSSAPADVSPATQGVKITVTQSGIKPSSQFFVLSSSQSYCQGGTPNTALRCQLVFSVPSGADTFAIDGYAGTTATSLLLESGSVSETIPPNGEKTLNVSLSGVAAYLQIALENPYPPAGTPTSVPIDVTVADAWGYVIIGNYESSVVLSDSDTKATSLSQTTLLNSTQAGALKLVYNGKTLATAATITATMPGATESTTFQPGGKGIVANPALMRVSFKAFPTKVTLGGPGAIGPFAISELPDTAGHPACQGKASVRGAGKTFQVSATGSLGACWLVARDHAGHKLSIPVLVSAFAWQSPGPSPTPPPATPTPTPSPTPTPAIQPVQVTPQTANICPQTGQNACKPFSAIVTVKQPGTPGIFSENDNCSVNYVKLKALTTSGIVKYKVIGQGATGTCQATFTGFGGKKGSLTINVQGSGIIINDPTRDGSGQKEPRRP